jgi:hypothetical protein
MIHVQPCTSTAEIYDRVRAARLACYGKPKVVNIASDLRKAKAVEAEKQALLVRDDFFGPLDFIRHQCELLGTTYEEVSAVGRLDRFGVENRRTVILAVMEKYPTLSLPRIGAIFNRDHSSIHFTLGTIPKRPPPARDLTARTKRARKLYDQDLTIAEIAEIIGVNRSTVTTMKRREQWPDRVRPVRKAKGK